MEINEKNLFIANQRLKEIDKELAEVKIKADALALQKKTLAAEEAKIKLDIITVMQDNKQKSAEFDYISVNLPKPKQVVSITDFTKLPDKFKKEVKPSVPSEADFDKNKIKKALNNKEEFEGAKLIDGAQSVTIEEIDPE